MQDATYLEGVTTNAQKLTLATLLTTFALVTMGVIVRSYDAGMGCPDWPLCHGQLVPSLGDYKAWLEWIHRSIAALLGFLGTTGALRGKYVPNGTKIELEFTRTGFRFGKLLYFRDAQFLPGGAKYGDVPGLLALNAPAPLWVGGETAPALTAKVYSAANASFSLAADAKADRAAAARWLLAE